MEPLGYEKLKLPPLTDYEKALALKREFAIAQTKYLIGQLTLKREALSEKSVRAHYRHNTQPLNQATYAYLQGSRTTSSLYVGHAYLNANGEWQDVDSAEEPARPKFKYDKSSGQAAWKPVGVDPDEVDNYTTEQKLVLFGSALETVERIAQAKGISLARYGSTLHFTP